MDEWSIWLGRITIYNCKSQCLLAAHWSDSWTRFFLSNLLSCFYLACLNEMYTWTPGSTQDRFMLLACHEHIFSFQFVTLHLIATFIKAVSFISRVSLGTFNFFCQTFNLRTSHGYCIHVSWTRFFFPILFCCNFQKLFIISCFSMLLLLLRP